jgi:hypothetical protein
VNFYLYKSQDIRETYEELNIFEGEKPKKCCSQYPWWNLGELANNETSYDIALSNANLLEFSNFALHDYLSLIKLKLSKEGLFIYHCEGDNVNNNLESLYNSMHKLRYAPLFTQSSALMVVKNIEKLKSAKKLLLAPVNASTKLLLSTKEFTQKYDEIYVLDDNTIDSYLEGFKIISRDELANLHIKDGLVVTKNREIKEMFQEYFTTQGIQNITFEESAFTKSFGIFINETHTLFTQYYDRKNFKIHFDSQEQIVKDFFSFDILQKKKYTKADILKLLN